MHKILHYFHYYDFKNNNYTNNHEKKAIAFNDPFRINYH